MAAGQKGIAGQAIARPIGGLGKDIGTATDGGSPLMLLASDLEGAAGALDIEIGALEEKLSCVLTPEGASTATLDPNSPASPLAQHLHATLQRMHKMKRLLGGLRDRLET